MALHFILDGYNLIKQTEWLADKKLEDSRNALLKFIESQRPQGSIKNKVTVVFDGQPGFARDDRKSFASVIFSCNETADDKIKHLVRGQKNRKSMVVVTNDRDIRYYVRSLGAKILKVEEFLVKASDADAGEKRQGNNKGRAGKESLKGITKTLEHKINLEFKEIWLKKK
jgi:predicted RNA-binding protein with PIN domain